MKKINLIFFFLLSYIYTDVPEEFIDKDLVILPENKSETHLVYDGISKSFQFLKDPPNQKKNKNMVVKLKYAKPNKKKYVFVFVNGIKMCSNDSFTELDPSKTERKDDGCIWRIKLRKDGTFTIKSKKYVYTLPHFGYRCIEFDENVQNKVEIKTCKKKEMRQRFIIEPYLEDVAKNPEDPKNLPENKTETKNEIPECKDKPLTMVLPAQEDNFDSKNPTNNKKPLVDSAETKKDDPQCAKNPLIMILPAQEESVDSKDPKNNNSSSINPTESNKENPKQENKLPSTVLPTKNDNINPNDLPKINDSTNPNDLPKKNDSADPKNSAKINNSADPEDFVAENDSSVDPDETPKKCSDINCVCYESDEDEESIEDLESDSKNDCPGIEMLNENKDTLMFKIKPGDGITVKPKV